MGKNRYALSRRIDRSLAKDAAITVEWLETIVSLAKRQWKVEEFDFFYKQLLFIVEKRKLSFHTDMEKVLRNCWFFQST